MDTTEAALAPVFEMLINRLSDLRRSGKNSACIETGR
jgi:hypothetical protein